MARPKIVSNDPNKASQAAYAKHRGVVPSTITVWGGRGLLVRDAAGWIDIAATDARLAERPEVYRGGITNQIAAKPQGENPDARVLAALVALVGSIEAIVAAAAVDSGAPLKTAFATAAFAAAAASELAEEILSELDIDVDGLAVWPAPGEGYAVPDWKVLAKQCGERLNFTALEAHVAELQEPISPATGRAVREPSQQRKPRRGA
jgi:hypothetical protein